jgi:glycosyltransferase involved in cell wall biosynthesis
VKGNKKKVLLIGPYPPPEGGVSIHLQRLLRKSATHPGLELAILDISRMKFVDQNENSSGAFSALKFFLSASIVHIHLSHPIKSFIGQIVKLFGKKLFYTQHNPRMADDSSTRNVIRMSDKVIFVYKDERYPERLVIPAYIPAENDSILPEEIEKLCEGRRVVVTLGTAPLSQSDSDDVYGFDIILNSIEKLQVEEKCLFLFVDVNGTFKKRCKQRIVELQNKVGSNILISYLSSGIDFPALLKKADVYIRATRSDGDSLAVREALNTGAIVVASDCSIRPNGCVLFETGDADALALKVSEALKGGRKVFVQEDYSERLLALYLS